MRPPTPFTLGVVSQICGALSVNLSGSVCPTTGGLLPSPLPQKTTATTVSRETLTNHAGDLDSSCRTQSRITPSRRRGGSVELSARLQYPQRRPS